MANNIARVEIASGRLIGAPDCEALGFYHLTGEPLEDKNWRANSTHSSIMDRPQVNISVCVPEGEIEGHRQSGMSRRTTWTVRIQDSTCVPIVVYRSLAQWPPVRSNPLLPAQDRLYPSPRPQLRRPLCPSQGQLPYCSLFWYVASYGAYHRSDRTIRCFFGLSNINPCPQTKNSMKTMRGSLSSWVPRIGPGNSNQ